MKNSAALLVKLVVFMLADLTARLQEKYPDHQYAWLKVAQYKVAFKAGTRQMTIREAFAAMQPQTNFDEVVEYCAKNGLLTVRKFTRLDGKPSDWQIAIPGTTGKRTSNATKPVASAADIKALI